MSMNFGEYAGKESKGGATVPHGTLAFVSIHVREIKIGREKGTRFLDCELTILPSGAGHPFAGRKIFTNIMDPTFEGNSDAAKEMGQIAICRILEVNGASPANPGGYVLPAIEGINGMIGAIRIKLVPPKDGYDEKNEVGDWLTPNPASKTGNKGYADLLAGKVIPAPKPGVATGQGFTAPAAGPGLFPAAAPAQPAQPAFPGAQQPAQQQPGFPQPQPGSGAPVAAAPGFGMPAPTAGMTSPSSGAPAASSWLTQAQQR